MNALEDLFAGPNHFEDSPQPGVSRRNRILIAIPVQQVTVSFRYGVGLGYDLPIAFRVGRVALPVKPPHALDGLGKHAELSGFRLSAGNAVELDVRLDPRTQGFDDVLGACAFHDLLNGKALPLWVFAMKEGGRNPGLIGYEKAGSRGNR
jgi:hypothetical protein